MTAEEFVKNRFQNSSKADFLNNKENIIEFAKLHVEKALKARDRLYQTYFNELSIVWTEENKKFIEDSYPLENIK